jgi:HAMP domain-containing protein
VLAEITEHFKAYCEARDALLASTTDHPLLDYDKDAFPRFDDVKKSVLELLDINHQATMAADQSAQRSANLRAVLHGLLVAVALLSLGLLSREMRRIILDRLEELKSVADAISHGDRSRRVSVRHTDELGLVARQLNAILDREQDIEGEMNARLIEHRRWILSLLRRLDRPTALFSLSGDLVASSLPPSEQRDAHEAVRKELIEKGKALPSSKETIAGEYRILLELMTFENEQPVGWFATFTTEENHTTTALEDV